MHKWQVVPALLLALSVPWVARGQGETPNKARNRRAKSCADDFDKILELHNLWLSSKGKQGERANLSRCDLHGMNLYEVNLSKADIFHSNLSEVNLTDADLTEANLFHSNLTGAYLNGTKLKGADLGLTYMDGTSLLETDLSGANLALADLRNAIYEPKSHPDFDSMATARSLSLMTYEKNSTALALLRKAFQDGGLREQEREITYVLNRVETKKYEWGCPWKTLAGNKIWKIQLRDYSLTSCANLLLRRVFFDWTCSYGMDPGKPLVLASELFVICSGFYFVFLHFHGKSAIYRVYAATMQTNSGAERSMERVEPRVLSQRAWWTVIGSFLWREIRLLLSAMYFSLVSAFNIGFHEINLGRWLRLLTRQEFDLKAEGWVRVVAGWQSVISMYLVALWVLTYFGRPFE